MNDELKLVRRLYKRSWAIGTLHNWYVLGTPWFVLMLADPDGAYLTYHRIKVFAGMRIKYQLNRNWKMGELLWLKEKIFIFQKLTKSELINCVVCVGHD